MLKKGEELKRIGTSFIIISLFLSLFAFTSNIQPAKAWTGTVYIMADGTIVPADAPVVRNGDSYALTGSILLDGYGIWVSRDNIVIDGSGYTVQGDRNVYPSYGVYVPGDVTNVTIKNMIVNSSYCGIRLYRSSGNSVWENNITDSDYGIMIDYSANNNSIIGNNIGSDTTTGIFSFNSTDIKLIRNKITYCGAYAVDFVDCSNNTITENEIGMNNIGISLSSALLSGSNNNTVANNDIANNFEGVMLYSSSNNLLYHNNFVGNTHQVSTDNSVNACDDGYPSGGNYWSDYTGVDVKRGSGQDLSGSDGIGDTPYVIDANNQDNYPLMKPYGGEHDIGITSLSPYKTIIGYGYYGSPTFSYCPISAKIVNYGTADETFDITIYINTTIIQTFTNIVLTSRNSTVLFFTWSAFGIPAANYTLKAVASEVPSEVDITDNTCTFGLIQVTIPGDYNGDFIVNIKDAAPVGVWWMRLVPPAPSNIDVENDGFINIREATVIGVNWLKHA